MIDGKASCTPPHGQASLTHSPTTATSSRLSNSSALIPGSVANLGVLLLRGRPRWPATWTAIVCELGLAVEWQVDDRVVSHHQACSSSLPTRCLRSAAFVRGTTPAHERRRGPHPQPHQVARRLTPTPPATRRVSPARGEIGVSSRFVVSPTAMGGCRRAGRFNRLSQRHLRCTYRSCTAPSRAPSPRRPSRPARVPRGRSTEAEPKRPSRPG